MANLPGPDFSPSKNVVVNGISCLVTLSSMGKALILAEGITLDPQELLTQNSSSSAARTFRSALSYRSYITRKYSHFASFPKPNSPLKFLCLELAYILRVSTAPLGLHFARRDGRDTPLAFIAITDHNCAGSTK
jgi:hypothetical protein